MIVTLLVLLLRHSLVRLVLASHLPPSLFRRLMCVVCSYRQVIVPGVTVLVDFGAWIGPTVLYAGTTA